MMGVAPGPGIFIDRLNGSDSNPGTFALPWKNLSKLLAARLTQGQSIYLACGATWRESIALSQTQLVSGITVTGYGPSCATAKPTISGADDLSSGWAKQGTVWSRRLPVGTPKVTRLFVNGVPLRTAQWPNFGGVGREYAAAQAASPVSSTALRQSTADAAALAGRDVVGATMRVRSTPWQIDTGVVLAYASDTITLAKATTYPMGAGNGYVLQDKLWMLDAAGEFFHDTASGTLYVYPPDTATQVDLNTALVEGSVRNTVLSVSGVSGITLRGLALIMSQGDGLSVMEAPGLVADQIDASHNGAAGIRVGLSVTPATGRGGTFKNSTMTDNWINGIYSWNAVNVDVIGNTIVDTGMLATAGGAMAAIMSGPGAVVNQNLIQRAGYHGIFYSGTGGSNITNNVIEGYCARLSDCAGIYTWNSATLAARNTLNQASLVQGNTVLTAAANMDGAQGGAGAEVVAGIYLDNLTSNAVVQSNMLYGMPTGIVLHNSSSNTVSGNRVWMTTSAGLWATMDHTEADLMTGNSVTGNQFAPASSASGTWPAIPALTTSKALSYWNRLTGSTPTSVGTNNFSRNEVVYLQGTAPAVARIVASTGTKDYTANSWTAIAAGDMALRAPAKFAPWTLTTGLELVTGGKFDTGLGSWTSWFWSGASGGSARATTAGTGCTGTCILFNGASVYDALMSPAFTMATGTPHMVSYTAGFRTAGSVAPPNINSMTNAATTMIGAAGLSTQSLLSGSTGDVMSFSAFFMPAAATAARINLSVSTPGLSVAFDDVSVRAVTAYTMAKTADWMAVAYAPPSATKTVNCSDLGWPVGCTVLDIDGAAVALPLILSASTGKLLLRADASWRR